MSEVALIYIAPPYAIAVGAAYALLSRIFRERFKPGVQDFALAIPIFVYGTLYQVQDRQGLYFLHATLITTITVCCALPIKAIIPKQKGVAAAVVVTAGSIAAALSWLCLPDSGPILKNAPGVW